MAEPKKPGLLRRILLGGVLGAGAIIFLAIAFAAWLLGTRPGAAFVLEQAAAIAGARVSGVEGRIAGALSVGTFSFESAQVRVRLEKASLAWSPLALLGGTLRIDRLHAAALDIATASSAEPGREPASLAPSFGVLVSSAGLDRLRIGTIGQEGGIELRDLSGNSRATALRGFSARRTRSRPSAAQGSRERWARARRFRST
jgi:autotransporter translocation and assembly factor TamB